MWGSKTVNETIHNCILTIIDSSCYINVIYGAVKFAFEAAYFINTLPLCYVTMIYDGILSDCFQNNKVLIDLQRSYFRWYTPLLLKRKWNEINSP